jgi:uncharacterized protein
MTDTDAPKIEFPCNYPIKVMGEACDEFHQHVMAVFDEHAPGYDRSLVTVRDSRNGKFQAITVTITATGTTQLEAIFEGLKRNRHVQMVL